MWRNKLTLIFLVLIIVLSIVTRFFKLAAVPASITWDEAAVGYNAYTILNWGKDEWGRPFPVTFKSFGDDKNPVHVYLTAPFIAAFGLNDFAVRASAATFGVLNVIILFLLARLLFKSDMAALISSFILAISPFNLQFSRFNHELNFAIFMFLFGFYLILAALESGKGKYLIFGFLFLGLDLLTYQSAKVVTPPLVILFLLINFKKLIKFKNYFYSGLIIYSMFIMLLFIKPELLGIARLNQNQIKEELIFETQSYKKTNNINYGKLEVVWERYKKYFGNEFLFLSGDPNPRHSIQTFGTFYRFEIYFMIIGLIGLLYKILFKKDYNLLIILAAALLAPLPAAASSDVYHAPRAMFITFSHILLSGYGVYLVATIIKNKYYQFLLLLLFLALSLFYFSNYLKSYYLEYPNKYAIEWIYGMKEIAEEAKKDEYFRVYMTDSRMQPYIFFLYFNNESLPEFLSTVKYNQTQSAPHNLVASFSKYKFVWNEYNSLPAAGVLYVVKPSIYDGLYHKEDFKVVKLVKNPDGSDAFYLITSKGN